MITKFEIEKLKKLEGANKVMREALEIYARWSDGQKYNNWFGGNAARELLEQAAKIMGEE